MSATRISDVKRKLKAENLDGMIITHLDHIRYLTGFDGSSALLVITLNGADFFTDSRYSIQARQQVKGARIHLIKASPISSLLDFPEFNVRNKRYGFTAEYLSVSTHELLAQVLPDVLLVKADSVFAQLGWVKDKSELANIERAVKIADTALSRVLQLVVPGVRERELAAELEYQMAMLGSEKPAFESIVASGYRSAMPHGLATSKKVKKGEFVTFDFGATVGGYVSDTTRTVVVGRATSRQKKVYDIVLRAQLAAIRKIKSGVSGKTVDETARRIIQKAGFGKNFGHGLGHGIGFYIHVGPRMGPQSKDKLMTGNVITVEPGIYIEGWGGVRIEDDVLVTRSGSRVLNKAEKKLLEL
jgi:Xaa-Pro aminopeptidase